MYNATTKKRKKENRGGMTCTICAWPFFFWHCRLCVGLRFAENVASRGTVLLAQKSYKKANHSLGQEGNRKTEREWKKKMKQALLADSGRETDQAKEKEKK